MKEVFRWNVVAPLAVPHRTEEEDWQDGKYIPAGTLVIPNIWLVEVDIASALVR